MKNRHSNNKGAVLVETTLVFPLLVTFLLGFYSCISLFRSYNALGNIIRNGMLWATANITVCSVALDANGQCPGTVSTIECEEDDDINISGLPLPSGVNDCAEIAQQKMALLLTDYNLKIIPTNTTITINTTDRYQLITITLEGTINDPLAFFTNGRQIILTATGYRKYV